MGKDNNKNGVTKIHEFPRPVRGEFFLRGLRDARRGAVKRSNRRHPRDGCYDDTNGEDRIGIRACKNSLALDSNSIDAPLAETSGESRLIPLEFP